MSLLSTSSSESRLRTLPLPRVHLRVGAASQPRPCVATATASLDSLSGWPPQVASPDGLPRWPPWRHVLRQPKYTTTAIESRPHRLRHWPNHKPGRGNSSIRGAACSPTRRPDRVPKSSCRRTGRLRDRCSLSTRTSIACQIQPVSETAASIVVWYEPFANNRGTPPRLCATFESYPDRTLVRVISKPSLLRGLRAAGSTTQMIDTDYSVRAQRPALGNRHRPRHALSNSCESTPRTSTRTRAAQQLRVKHTALTRAASCMLLHSRFSMRDEHIALSACISLHRRSSVLRVRASPSQERPRVRIAVIP